MSETQAVDQNIVSALFESIWKLRFTVTGPQLLSVVIGLLIYNYRGSALIAMAVGAGKGLIGWVGGHLPWNF